MKAVDSAYVEWDYIPTSGEVYVIKNTETDNTYLKIGDGKHKLRDLSYISTSILGDEADMENTIRETCAQCGHLYIINRNKIYAVCDEMKLVKFLNYGVWILENLMLAISL